MKDKLACHFKLAMDMVKGDFREFVCDGPACRWDLVLIDIGKLRDHKHTYGLGPILIFPM